MRNNFKHTANGIASLDTADLDLDHIVDYIYAGDLQGHVWRFDVTQQDPAKWAVSTNSPLFTTPSGAPITAGLTVSTLKQLSTRWFGVVAEAITAAGVCALSPAAIKARVIRSRLCITMYSTIGWPVRASAVQSNSSSAP